MPNLHGSYYYLHLAEEDIEIQRDELPCQNAGLEWTERLSDFRVSGPTHIPTSVYLTPPLGFSRVLRSPASTICLEVGILDRVLATHVPRRLYLSSQSPKASSAPQCPVFLSGHFLGFTRQ